MKIEFIRCVIDEGNSDAPLTILIDDQIEKDIPWSKIDELMTERVNGADAHHSPEEALLARLACENWVDCDDWWQGVSGTSQRDCNSALSKAEGV